MKIILRALDDRMKINILSFFIIFFGKGWESTIHLNETCHEIDGTISYGVTNLSLANIKFTVMAHLEPGCIHLKNLGQQPTLVRMRFRFTRKPLPNSLDADILALLGKRILDPTEPTTVKWWTMRMQVRRGCEPLSELRIAYNTLDRRMRFLSQGRLGGNGHKEFPLCIST